MRVLFVILGASILTSFCAVYGALAILSGGASC